MSETPSERKELAEAEAAEATAKLNRAEARKAKAEAKKIEAEVIRARIQTAVAIDIEAARASRDEFHRVYRFNDHVNYDSTNDCMAKLNEWHRQDPTCDIEVVFSSPGGNVLPGLGLFDFLQEIRKTHTLTTGVSGMAASMAGVLLQAGDVRWCGEQSWVMIHRSSFGIAGFTHDVEDQLLFVQRLEGQMIDIFTKRSFLTPKKIKKNWDRKDWWIDSNEALKLGLIDEIRGQLSTPLPKRRSKDVEEEAVPVLKD